MNAHAKINYNNESPFSWGQVKALADGPVRVPLGIERDDADNSVYDKAQFESANAGRGVMGLGKAKKHNSHGMQAAAVAPSTSVSPFCGMASMLVANPEERLLQVARTLSGSQMRELPSTVVTSDDEVRYFSRSRRIRQAEMRLRTGFDTTATGREDVVSRAQNSPDALERADIDRSTQRRQAAAAAGGQVLVRSCIHQASVGRAHVANRDETGRITMLVLPRGGHVTPSEVRDIQAVGAALLLQLDRRVNAKSLWFTREFVEALRTRLECVLSQLQAERLRAPANDSTSPAGERFVTLPGGGSSQLNQISSARYAGPAVTLELARRVNSRSIALALDDAKLLLAQLRELELQD